MHSHPIWIDVDTHGHYKSSKSFGGLNYIDQDIKVGSSASNSHDLASVQVDRVVTDDEVSFALFVDRLKIKEMIFTNNHGRAGEHIRTITY